MESVNDDSCVEITLSTKQAYLKKWIDALRSGKYTQGKGALKTADGKNCCLGVLCEVIGAKFNKKENVYKIAKNHPLKDLFLTNQARNTHIPYGLDAILPGGISFGILAKRNDEELHWSFEKIARYLEGFLSQ